MSKKIDAAQIWRRVAEEKQVEINNLYGHLDIIINYCRQKGSYPVLLKLVEETAVLALRPRDAK